LKTTPPTSGNAPQPCPLSPQISCVAPLAAQLNAVLAKKPRSLAILQQFIQELLAEDDDEGQDEPETADPAPPRPGWRGRLRQ
jgi:hypothetical protein